MAALPSLPRSWERRGWSSPMLGAGVLLMVAGVLATLDAWLDMLDIAIHREEDSHILLVPVVMAWLVWVRRGRFRHLPARGRYVGPCVVALGWFLYSAGDLLLIQAFWHAGAVAVVTGCFLSVAGVEVLRRFFPAFLLLAFLVPVPGRVRQAVALPLQTVTATWTQAVLDLAGISAEQTGNVITINGTRVAIAEACNGLRMVFALFFVSVAFAYGSPLRWYVRLLIVVLSPLSAILCNVLRLVPTVWLYGFTSPATADRFHDVSGWLMLPVAFLLLLGVVRALRWAYVPIHRYRLIYGS